MESYITSLGVFLPNEPVSNDQIEAVLGMVSGYPSRVRPIILKRNGIQTRHYARDPRDGQQTHTNSQLTAEAIRSLTRRGDFPLTDIELLSCGTSSPDQIMPSHAAMVHGELRSPPCEIASSSGVCCSGMIALKYAHLSVLGGAARLAVATGSELSSAWLHAGAFYGKNSTADPEKFPYVAFDQDFLRWMLSDGAGAVAIEPRPRPGRPSLRIDWIDVISLANALEPCMYCGAVKRENGEFHTWRQLDKLDTAFQDGYINLAQDVKLLKEKMIPVAFRDSFSRTIARHHLSADRVDWWLPHISSEFFRQPTYDMLAELDFEIPAERWFTNLTRKGNTGSASIYIMLEELWSSGRLEPGQRVLCGVPESARFTFAYMHLTVV